jgi:TatD DNase family protein
MLIDTHCHIDFQQFDSDREEVVRRAKENGIDYLINIGSSLEGSNGSVDLSRQYENIYATVGIHPHEADTFKEKDLAILKQLARNKKVVAIGEIGLDYYKNFSKAENQRLMFASLIGLAKESNLPLVVHCRAAESDTLKLLKERMPLRAVVHCFSGDEPFLKECLELGFFISFTCNITYKKALNLREIVRLTPLEKMFLETDAPYLSPEGLRGRRNEPANVKILAQEVASIKEISVEEVARVTSESAIKFFSLKTKKNQDRVL